MLEDILLQVNKPARYIGNEWNAAQKDFKKAEIKFALCFPDLYEVGMSNLGIRILYSLLNNTDGVVCERVFHPAADMEALMRSSPFEIFSLESRRKLTEFDFIGFSLGFELSYTNMLNMLYLAGIPLKASERAEGFPLVIAGGSCSLNPEPVAEFIDLFVIGEAEEAILEIVDTYKSIKAKVCSGSRKKKEILSALAQIEGVYVPSFYQVEYHPDATLSSFQPNSADLPKRIKKRTISDLGKNPFPVKWLLPYIQIIHDRLTIELMRGCPNRCRFCQARSTYFPFRQVAPEKIIQWAKESYSSTGYEEISLLGLCVSDYYRIEQLIGDLLALFKKDAVSLSLPSLKPRDNTKELLTMITKVKKTGLTLAPEAATVKMQQIINKDFNADVFFATIEHAYRLGYQHVKLYFMIGLPHEGQPDLDGIAELALAVSQLKRKIDGKPAMVNISISTLIPKPHTPFQWLAMEGLGEIEKKQDYLRSRLRKEKIIKVSFHNRYMSFIEGILSRADRRVSALIFHAWKKGARFDAWDNYFSFRHWQDSFAQAGINPEFYLSRGRGEEEILPWEFIDSGISKVALLEEARQCL